LATNRRPFAKASKLFTDQAFARLTTNPPPIGEWNFVGAIMLSNTNSPTGAWMLMSEPKDTIDSMTEKGTYDRLQKDVEAVKSDISTLTDQITEALNTFANSAQSQAKRGYKQARSNVNSVMSDASEKGSAALSAAQEAAATLEETIEDAIIQRPLATVGLAIGLGFLIGVTWRR
jgi:ElaB/YqjD/DUF883 family membrane-anchored ribosome-binding protein